MLKPSLKHLNAIELPTPFPVGPITVYLADAPGEPLTLIDSGPHTSEARKALKDGLATLGYRPDDLARIVITHAHVDHFGLAAELATTSGAQVLSHPMNTLALGDYDGDRTRRVAFYGEMLRQAAVPPEVMISIGKATGGIKRFAHPIAIDTPLGEGDTLSLASRTWQVLHTPGHAAGLICLYEPTSQTLLSSDHLLADISSNPVLEPPLPGEAERPKSLVLYKASLQRVADMDIAVALPSHGPAIYDVNALVSKRLSFHQRRMDRIKDALHNGARTTWDVTQALFRDRSPLDTFLAVSEVIGHLDMLEMENEILGENRNGVVIWRLC